MVDPVLVTAALSVAGVVTMLVLVVRSVYPVSHYLYSDAVIQSRSTMMVKDKVLREMSEAKQLAEIEAFKGKIDELLAGGYNPMLDDGVGKNIAPLQQKKMIPYEVLNPGQLKKYLNADW